MKVYQFLLGIIGYRPVWAGSSSFECHYETRLLKYIENFTTKNLKLSDKNSDIFHIFAQNIDYGYSLEPPRRGGANEYPQFLFLSKNKKNNVHPWKPQFYYIKVGFKGQNYISIFSWCLFCSTLCAKSVFADWVIWLLMCTQCSSR